MPTVAPPFSSAYTMPSSEAWFFAGSDVHELAVSMSSHQFPEDVPTKFRSATARSYPYSHEHGRLSVQVPVHVPYGSAATEDVGQSVTLYCASTSPGLPVLM